MLPPKRTIWHYISRLKILTSFEPEVSFLGIFPKDTLVHGLMNVRTRMVMAAELVIAKDWTQLKGLSRGGLLNKF